MKYQISKKTHDALLYMYYGILESINKKHGLAYHQAFQAKKTFDNIENSMKNVNINDFIEVVD